MADLLSKSLTYRLPRSDRALAARRKTRPFLRLRLVRSPSALVDDLLDLDDDKLRRIERREADSDVKNALGDSVVGVVLGVAFDEIGLLLACAGECAQEKQALHEGAD